MNSIVYMNSTISPQIRTVGSESLLKDFIKNDGSLVVGSDLDKFSSRWKIVEKHWAHARGIQISRKHANFQKATKQMKKK